MQFERSYRLNQSKVAWFAHLHQVGFQPTSPNLGKHLWLTMWVWSLCPSTSWEGAQTPHIYVWHGHGMQFERFYSLNQSVVAWFVYLASGRISANFHKSGEVSVVVNCEWEGKCPSTTREGTQTPHICMKWIWDAVWKVLQPQSKCSGMVSTLASGRISANFSKSGEASVVVTVWVSSHMPINNLWRCSNTSYMYDMDMGCILKGFTASAKI